MFDPKTNKFPYPMDTGTHYLHVKKDNGNVYDTKYPYIDESLGFRIKKFFFNLLLVLIAFPVSTIRMGFKVKGKENLKKYKEEIKKGVVSVSNHVHMWDYMSIMHAAWPHKTHILSWDKNISGENGPIIRMSGGIPVPTQDQRGFVKMAMDTINMIKKGGWLHIMPEGTMWEFYGPIRPFKDGAAFFAYKANRPILPMAFSYRPVGWIRKRIFKQIASLTLNIGEPIYPDMSLPQSASIKDLTLKARDEVCRLAGIDPKENIYQPLYTKETGKRIDYYTDTYGVGYKGSH